ALVELDLVLREVRGLHTVSQLDRARRRRSLAEHRLEERRLAGAVRPHEGDVLATLEHECSAVEQRLLPRRDVERIRLEYDASRTCGLQELETECSPSPRELVQLVCSGAPLLAQTADLLQLRLRLLGLRLLVAKPLHEPLEPFDVLVDPSDGLRRVRRATSLLTPPLVPRPGEEERAAAVELEHGGRDRLEKPAIVRHDHDRRVEGRELLLEPLQRVDVQMVRR